MSIRSLRVFLATARLGSFSRAAAEMQLTQPAVSQQVRHLEKEVGALLFYRTKRTLSLTQAGLIVVERARQILAIYDNIPVELAGPQSLSGYLRLGVIPSILDGVLPQILKLILERHPNVRIAAFSGSPELLASRVESGELDAAITSSPEAFSAQLVERPLFDEPLWLVALQGSDRGEPPEFALAHSLIRLTDEKVIAKAIDRELERLNMAYERVIELDRPEAIINMIWQGLGIAVLPAVDPTRLIESGLKCRSFGAPQLKRHVVLLERQGLHPSRILSMLIEELKGVHHRK